MRHKHEWKITLYRASPLTTGASGKGRTVPWRRECTACGKKQWRHTDYEKRRTVWKDEGE